MSEVWSDIDKTGIWNGGLVLWNGGLAVWNLELWVDVDVL